MVHQRYGGDRRSIWPSWIGRQYVTIIPGTRDKFRFPQA